MPMYGAAVIDQDQVRLIVSRGQSAPRHLPIKAKLFSWASKNDAANGRAIEPLRQHHAIGDDFSLARR